MFIKKEICSKCGGECCKTTPGSYYPKDFNVSKDFSQLSIALSSGKIAIDWWEGDPRESYDTLDKVYFVRPAIKDKSGVLLDPSWGGECIFLGLEGCQLDENARPLNCRNLEPMEYGDCILHDRVSKKGASLAWLPYQEYLLHFIKTHE